MSQTFSSNDFNDIMDSLVLFMRNQDEFKDMNFDGSAIRELLRVLSFNSQQQAFQNNFVFNELQWDTAQLRKNMSSLASRLGYLPSSKTAARMKVNLVVVPADPDSAPSSIILSRNVQFYATKDGQTFIFSPDIDYVATLVNGIFSFSNVVLLQGIWALNGFMVQNQYDVESYVIPNSDVDISTLEVVVRASEMSGTQTLFSAFKTAYDLDPVANLFYLRENREGLYEFKFGDNKFSKRLDYGNVITARYLVTNGVDGNNITNITPANSISGYYDIRVSPVDLRSYGGADQEDIESIRTLAPISFAASGNAVTGGDYVGLAKKLFSETSDAISWGGEDNYPPRYGYVYVSVIPKNSDTLSSEQKLALADILKQYNVGSITPIIVDPEYTYINVNTTVKYKESALSISPAALETKIQDYCSSFSKDKMEKFGGELDVSRLSEFINKIDVSIIGNSTQVKYEKRFVPILNIYGSYILNFSHILSPGSVNITGFTVSDTDNVGWTYSIRDADGLLELIKTKESTVVTINSNVGNVDYDAGIISVNSFKPNSITGTYVAASAYCDIIDDQSMVGIRNSILKINEVDVSPVLVKK